jgi:serralysin
MVDKQGGRDGTDVLKDIRFAKFADGTTVALTNGSPTFINPASVTLAESKAFGATVATLSGIDPDGDTLTYSLVSDAGGLFGLRGGNQLFLNGALNYEGTKKYTITVKASDAYGGVLVKDLTINVTNVIETTPLVLRGTKASEQVVGESGGDRLYGLEGNDQLFGQLGRDTLYGGAGKDTLIGGLDRDAFVLDKKPTTKTVDWIYDFKVADDTVWLPKSVFRTLAQKGTLQKGAFVVGDRVLDADDRIIYLKKAGALFFDPDGTGAAAAYQIATISKNLLLTHKDFYVI